MSRAPVDVLPPRILIVDDERQIHASVRLRLGREYELVSCFNAREALERLGKERFDLCFADIHMPHMDGLTFIEHAREKDPALSYVVLSAFDSDENLRRAIPLQVLEFIGKPLPERDGFERRIPDWIARTRRVRQDRELAASSRTVAQDLASAQLAHEVELVASESARDALLQTANLLTTIHAHLVAATRVLAPRLKTDPAISPLLRNLEEARKTADAAVSISEGFFNSAYASRDSSPAFVDAGFRHAIDIARRFSGIGENDKAVDFSPLDERTIARGLSGIDLLLLLTPLVGIALAAARTSSTVRISGTHSARLDRVLKEPNAETFLWLNRKHALAGQPAVQVSFTAAAPAFARADIEAWLRGDASPLALVPARGLIAGLQKSQGMLGIAIAPAGQEFRLLLALPI